MHRDRLVIDSKEIAIGNEQKHHLQESVHNHKDRLRISRETDRQIKNRERETEREREREIK